MHEQSDRYRQRDRILSLGSVRSMDPGERSTLARRLSGMSTLELTQELRRINERP